MNKHTVVITPPTASRIFQVRLKDHFDKKEIDGIIYTVLPNKGFMISGISVTITMETEEDIFKDGDRLTEFEKYFDEEFNFDENMQYYIEKNGVKITLIK